MKYEDLPKNLNQYDPVRITYAENSQHHIKASGETHEFQLYLTIFNQILFNGCQQTVLMDDKEIHPVNPSAIPLEEIVEIKKL